jgi:hypothetical protein
MRFCIAPKCTIVAIGTAFALCATATFAAAPSHEEEQPSRLRRPDRHGLRLQRRAMLQPAIRRIRPACVAPRQKVRMHCAATSTARE